MHNSQHNFQAAKQNAKNKKRLIQQNTKLHNELQFVEAQITAMDHKIVSQEHADEDAGVSALSSELFKQQQYIKRLKTKLGHLKSQNGRENMQFIMTEENQLIVLKSELEQLRDEKRIFKEAILDKKKEIQQNQPLKDVQTSTHHSLKQIVKANNESSIKIQELDKEIRKYHLLYQLHKSHKEGPDHERLRLEQGITTCWNKTEDTKAKWKPQLAALDEEFWELKQKLKAKQSFLKQGIQEQEMWGTRQSAIRHQGQIEKDKERVSSLVVNVKLQKQLKEYIENQEEQNYKKIYGNRPTQQELKYQFVSTEDDKKSNVPVSFTKKKDEKIVENMENDKNIKKLPQGSDKTQKKDQKNNTEASHLSKGKTQRVINNKPNKQQEKEKQLSKKTQQQSIKRQQKQVPNKQEKQPSSKQEKQPSNKPEKQPSHKPEKQPTNKPEKQPSNKPEKQLSNKPEKQLSHKRQKSQRSVKKESVKAKSVEREELRSQRKWEIDTNNNNPELPSIAIRAKQAISPQGKGFPKKILLKNFGMGTTFQNDQQ